MRRFWIAPLGIIASLISVALIVQQLRSTIDVFELADPTGKFGIYFFLGGLAAHLAVLFVAVCVLLPRSQSNVRFGLCRRRVCTVAARSDRGAPLLSERAARRPLRF